jgi:GNAT superfamily N-acetyltransferase
MTEGAARDEDVHRGDLGTIAQSPAEAYVHGRELRCAPCCRITDLAPLHRFAIKRHFLALGAEDRRLRFGIAVRDEGIGAYVAGLDFRADTLLGAIDAHGQLIGIAHVARTGADAELGLSVLPQARNCGVGNALLREAVDRARAISARRLYMHCLSENARILHLALRNGMRVCRVNGEADAWLELDEFTVGFAPSPGASAQSPPDDDRKCHAHSGNTTPPVSVTRSTGFTTT